MKEKERCGFCEKKIKEDFYETIWANYCDKKCFDKRNEWLRKEKRKSKEY